MQKKAGCTYKKEPLSNIRKAYIARLVGRCLILVACVLLLLWRPEMLDALNGGRFFAQFSLLHILWLIWIVDMIHQLVPVKKHIPLGSQKLFRQRFQPIREKINYKALREHVISTTKAAYKIFALWATLILVLGALYHFRILSAAHLFLVSVFFMRAI